jgi:acetyltransferase-like isoleucine patch superfamily enzyme
LAAVFTVADRTPPSPLAAAARALREDQVRIGYDALVGRDVQLVYGAYVCDRVNIRSTSAMVHGLPDSCATVRVSGRDRPSWGAWCTSTAGHTHRGWWDVDEPSPVVHEDVVVGFGATVVGGVQLGPRSYVAAGAVVTTDVPPMHIVTGTNQTTHWAAWPGKRLQELLAH